MELTRSGVAYDFNVSPHKITVDYNDERITYTFSSNLYKTKFIDKLEENRKVINNSLTKRFGITLEFNLLADLKLYTTIEKRGFLIEDDSGKHEWQNTIKLSGNLRIMKN